MADNSFTPATITKVLYSSSCKDSTSTMKELSTVSRCSPLCVFLCNLPLIYLGLLSVYNYIADLQIPDPLWYYCTTLEGRPSHVEWPRRLSLSKEGFLDLPLPPFLCTSCVFPLNPSGKKDFIGLHR